MIVLPDRARPLRRGARQPRRVVMGLLALVLGLLVVAGSSPRDAHAEDGAVDVYGGCMITRKAGDLLIMIDESQSLDLNDPRDDRVTAARYLVERLTGFAERNRVDLQVQVAGFSHDYALAQDWTQLDSAGRDRTLQTIDSFASARPYGFETDYWAGLEGARRALAGHNPSGDRCQALVWITDGALDIDWRRDADQRSRYGEGKPYLEGRLDTPARAEQAETEAERQICRDGGLADQLRSSQVTIFGVGLRGIEEPDYTLLRSIALGGDAGGQHCGRLTTPPGNFTQAADIDDLLFEFDKFDDPSRQRRTTESGVCQGQPCPESRHTFVLDDSIQSVHVLGSAQVDQLEAYVVTPGEREVKLDKGPIGQSGAQRVGGTTLTWTWQSERTVVVDLAEGAGSDGWSGPWSMVFVDPTASSPDARSRTAISISGDVFPTWPGAADTTVRAGEVTPLTLGLVNGEGATVEASRLLGTVGMDVAFEAADGTRQEIARGLDRDAISTPQRLDLTQASPGPGQLVLSLAITTADATTPSGAVVKGTPLEPQTVRIPIDVQPPAGYPSVAGQVNFGSFEAPADQAGAQVAVTGPGCVWLENGGSPEITAGPEQLGQVAFGSPHDSAERCLAVAEGQTADLPLTLTTSGIDNGTLAAQLSIRVAPTDQPERAQDARIAATADFAKPLNTVNFVLTLIVALILGPGIPIGLLYLLKYLTARIPGRPLLAQEIPVAVQSGQLMRDGHPFTLQPRDLTSMVRLDNRGSRAAEAGSTSLQTRMGGSPFGVGHVLVSAPGRIGASSSHPRPYGPQRQARLPLNVHNHWVVLADPVAPAERATVLLLVAGDAPVTARDSLIDDLVSRAPELIERLGQRIGATGPAATADPFGGHPPGGGPTGTGGGASHPFDVGPDSVPPAGPAPTYPGATSSAPPEAGPSWGESPEHPPAPGTGGPANPFDFGAGPHHSDR